MKDLVGRLNPQVFDDREKIFEEGTPGEEMFFISAGQVSIVKGGVEVFRLDAGTMFGEMALLEANSVRSASAAALSPLDVFALRRRDFEAVLAAHPQERAAIAATALQRQGSLAAQSSLVRGRVTQFFG